MSRKTVEIFNNAVERSLTSSQSGVLTFIDTSSAGVTVNLPPIQPGLYYEFVISHTGTNANTFILKSVNTSYVHTALMYVGQSSATLAKTITLDSSSNAKLCDRIIVNSDGTNWFVTITTNISNIADYALTA